MARAGGCESTSIGRRLLLLFFVTVLELASALVELRAAASRRLDGFDAARCIHWSRPGKLLFYKDTVIRPIGISIPSALVARGLPGKSRLVAKFLGSSKGGNVSQYSFGPLEEDKYHAMYSSHRFAVTRKKGGWDAVRHVEIFAAGSVPLFEGLADTHSLPFVVPFLPRQQILDAERELLPYNKRYEAAYNATVRGFLAHTRRCLTSEAMATYVLRALGLWPTDRPLKILYVTCGWGWTQSLSDGWQGPVSIGLFLGLHLLLGKIAGSRIVDAPAMDPNPDIWPQEPDEALSHFWYCFKRKRGCKYRERDLRKRMYGFGFSYAFMLPRDAMATTAEREDVPNALQRREFDAVIYGKVGPRQGCDPLPFLDDVQAAKYPPQRVALIYGGDFGLKTREIARHARLVGHLGLMFFREIDAEPARYAFRPAAVLPSACYLDNEWRLFFKLWEMRLECWGCPDIDLAFESLWPSLQSSIVANLVVEPPGDGPVRMDDFEPCWSGIALLAFPLLARRKAAEAHEHESRCKFVQRHLADFATRTGIALPPGDASRGRARVYHLQRQRRRTRQRRRRYAADFLEAFGVRPTEVRAFACDACRSTHIMAACRGVAATASTTLGAFAADFDPGDARLTLAWLREQAWAQVRRQSADVAA